MKTRVKMHQLPGDVHKSEKIAMMEGKHPEKKRSKSFKKMVRAKERAVLKRRTKKEIKSYE